MRASDLHGVIHDAVAPAGLHAPAGRRDRRVIALIAVAAVAMFVVGLVSSRWRHDPGEPAWVEVDPPVALPDVVLTDTANQPYELRARRTGEVTLLFFGYLSCPDACPIQMSVLGRAFGEVAPDVRDRVGMVFVTTDPARDSPADLREYLDQFDPSFIGLTGSDDALREAQAAAGVAPAVSEPAGDDGSYLVGHAVQVLVFDADGYARRAYPLGVRAADWIHDLPELAAP